MGNRRKKAEKIRNTRKVKYRKKKKRNLIGDIRERDRRFPLQDSNCHVSLSSVTWSHTRVTSPAASEAPRGWGRGRR